MPLIPSARATSSNSSNRSLLTDDLTQERERLLALVLQIVVKQSGNLMSEMLNA